MNFEDLKGCLILLSYDTVRPEDESQTWHNVLPYTFEDGCLLRYELDGDDDIDHTIDLDNYAVAQRTPFDLDEFEKVHDLLIRILLTEGKEIIREAPFNEEDVVDNRITLTLYDSNRKEVLSRTRTFKNVPVKAAPEPVTPSTEDFLKSLDATIAARRAACINDWKRLGINLLKTFIIGALVFWWFSKQDFPKATIWLTSICSGIYFTYLWWCNTYQIPIFIIGFRERRAAERPWINGGFLIGLGFGLFFLIIPEVKIIHAYMITLIVALSVTFCWWLYWFIDDLLDNTAMRKALRIVQRSNSRLNRKRFFRNMFNC